MAVLYESCTTNYLTEFDNYVDHSYAQTFTPQVSHTITSVKLYVKRKGTIGNVTIGIYATSGGHVTGSALTSVAVDGSAWATSLAWKEWTFTTPIFLVASTKYAIRMEESTFDADNCPYWGIAYSAGAGPYANGNAESYDGSSWTGLTTYDFYFEEYGFAPPVNIVTNKILVAAGNNEIWYEDLDTAAGTMTELTTTGNAIDTSDQLIIFSAFQKAFVVNGSNLKIADFANTKIATTDVGSHPPDRGNILTGGTSTASMVVDYITSVTADAACTIYGYRTTTATFSSGETVTGTDDDDNTISFVTSAAETAPPHWYNWTVYGNDTTNYGTMPSKAYLGCRYRGRCVLSGNTNYPHQWYMSKIAVPFTWNYDSTDPLTAVAGQSADAGEIGDIVKALIPYGDDFLVFGCANSIHVLDGDPAAAGSIDEIDNSTGIFGAQAWCKDGQGNLYFFGSGGLYRMAGGRSKPENISIQHLPKWIDDWALDPSLHRVVLSYDPFRNGVIISKSPLVSGTNLNYFYDLKTEGFYPETYPDECAIYSSVDYNTNSSSLRGLILGGKDGYIRIFDDADKDDDAGASGNTAISSYATLPLIRLAEADDAQGKLTSTTFILAGGASSGDFSDTDGVSYEFHVADDAETCLEDIRDGATARESGTLSGTGRKNRIRKRVRGRWLGIKLYNSTATETWAINSISGEIRPAGKIK